MVGIERLNVERIEVNNSLSFSLKDIGQCETTVVSYVLVAGDIRVEILATGIV